jgi:hypothetical protein
MEDNVKIGAAGVLLLVSAGLLLWSGINPVGTMTLLAAAGVATTGLAVGSLLMGTTGADGRVV